METDPARVVVACVGNGLVADDAVGGAVFDCLAESHLPAHIRLEQLGTGGMALLDCLDGEPTLVVVDAVQLGSQPGTVHVLEWDAVPLSPGAAVSSHGVGVREVIEVGRLLYPDRMPERVVLVGIEGRCFDHLGGPMTPAVADAVPRAVRAVVNEIRIASKRLDR